MSGAYDAGFLQLVHQSSGAVVANGKLALDKTRRATLLADYQTGCILEHGVQVLHVNLATFATTFAIVNNWLWQ